MKKRFKYKYCIFYLNNDYWEDIQKQIDKSGYVKIKAIIPTVKTLVKTYKGKMIFTKTPLLFNYGFIKMPSECAFSRPFLNKLKKDVPGIHHWLKDTINLYSKKKKLRIDNTEDFDDFSIVAIASREEVKRFVKISKRNTKYNLDEVLNTYKPGKFVTLKGYPYEGISGTIKKLDRIKKTVVVEIEVLHGYMELSLPFDNVMYSIYQDYNPDTIQASFIEYDYNNITEDSINKIMTIKTY